MGGYGIRVILWLLVGIALAHHPHRAEWPVGRPSFRQSRLSASRSATSAIAGGPSVSSAAGRRSSMSFTVSAAADPFASGRTSRVGGPRVQLPRSFGRGSVRGIDSNGPMTGLPGFRPTLRQGSSSGGASPGRGPGYLVLPASALIRFLASRASSAGFPVRERQGMDQRGAGPSVSIIPLGQTETRNSLSGVLGISGNGDVSGGAAAVAPGPPGVAFLGSQANQLAGLANALASSDLSIVLSGSGPSANVLNNQASVVQPSSTNGNSANNIIIGNPGSSGGTTGNQLVIGGNGGTITIRGDLLTGGGAPRIEPDEIEAEESRKNSNAGSGAATQKHIGGNQTIVLDSGGGKTQTIVIGSGGGSFTINDRTSGGVKIPGNATFILKAGTTPRIIDV